MKIRVEETKKKRLTLEEDEPAEHYAPLAEVEKSGEARFTAPVHVEVSAFWEHDHVRVAGKVATAAALTCSRCLTEFETPLESSFTIIYSQARDESPADEEVELSEEDLVAATYQGDEIDLDFEIAEQVMMEVPYKPLCREACKGLCTECGQDLNVAECGCNRGGINLKMSALQKIKIEK
ncbi:DUF177 domain-containing protein [Geomonas sp. RF6]|uniref:YceD family protein n=1 Tax=Geomonas sp. RF6 TaxID=2897342 RepID=UPI001E3CC0A0|nr:DUF177 domain-containing protein [Geomonas sp. RF6]UFS69250.1 DUF177 domain-containing protein [Geomonas sp. RF6]